MFDVLIILGVVSGVFWLGYFTASCMHLAKAIDKDEQDIYEHWRGER